MEEKKKRRQQSVAYLHGLVTLGIWCWVGKVVFQWYCCPPSNCCCPVQPGACLPCRFCPVWAGGNRLLEPGTPKLTGTQKLHLLAVRAFPLHRALTSLKKEYVPAVPKDQGPVPKDRDYKDSIPPPGLASCSQWMSVASSWIVGSPASVA